MLTVNGRVGLVEDGSTLGRPRAHDVGAWPPAPLGVEGGVDGAAPERPAMVSTKPLSLSVSVWIATWMSVCSATVRQLSIAAGVVPQSSCSFRPMAPASHLLLQRRRRLALPLPKKPRFIGKASAASSMRWMCQGPACSGGEGAGGWPGAAAEHGGDARHQRLLDLLRQMKWMWLSMPPAVTIMPSPAITSVPAPIGIVHARAGCPGLPPLPMAQMRPSQADVGLHDAPPVDDQRVGDDQCPPHVSPRSLILAHAVADGLAAAELHLLAVDGLA